MLSIIHAVCRASVKADVQPIKTCNLCALNAVVAEISGGPLSFIRRQKKKKKTSLTQGSLNNFWKNLLSQPCVLVNREVLTLHLSTTIRFIIYLRESESFSSLTKVPDTRIFLIAGIFHSCHCAF